MFNIANESLLQSATNDSLGIKGAVFDWVIISRIQAGLSTHHDTLRHYTTDMEGIEVSLNKVFHDLNYVLTPASNIGVNMLGFKKDEKNNCVHVMARLDYSAANMVRITLLGDKEEVNSVVEILSKDFKEPGATIETATDINSQGRLLTDITFLPKNNRESAHQSFYPWLTISLADYYDAFMASKETILLLFGDAGTGKSTFLRSLISHGSYNSLLAYNETVIQSAQLLAKFYQQKKTRILAYEDIDRFLGKREDGNPLMSSLLNAAEGVVKYPNKKIVLSTNLSSINQIDPALLRVGRCFDILQFRNLTPDEAMVVNHDMGLDVADYTGRNSWSLAEVLNPVSSAQQQINRFGKKMGFAK